MEARSKRLVILGATGSIGRQTLDVVRAFPDRFQVIGLAAGGNRVLFAEQVREFRPQYVFLNDAGGPTDTLYRLADSWGGEILSPELMATLPEADMVIVATSGTAGMASLLAAVRAGKKIALANKESLVSAGEIITAEASRSGAQILPVDSEHSAIWQCLAGEQDTPRRIVLTASGGPFREYNLEMMARVTVAQALQHPSWKMGKKVTIDSATLMNKGLEVIEARWLFNLPIESISVLVHPQSIVHSMVEFRDGSVKAQLGLPDMRLPIQYALSYPERLDNPALGRIDWTGLRGLTFEMPDTERFPCLRLAIEAGRRGGTFPAALCAADEAAVELFLAGRIGFLDIPRLVEVALERHETAASPGMEEILAAGDAARRLVVESAGGGAR